MGMSSTATSDMALAGGFNSHAHGAFSFAYGNQVLTNGANSFAFGRFVEATATSAIIFGTGYDLNNKLTNNTTSSFMIGFNSDVPTFIVEGNGGLNRTGRIGIGNVTAPQAKLHIRSDWNESAFIRIENTNTDSIAGITFGDGTQSITTSQEMPFTFNSGQNDYFFEGGRVGIGTTDFGNNKLAVAGNIKAEGLELSADIFIEDIDHGIIMKSPDGNCWRGTLNNLGQLQFTQVDCEELTVSTPEPEPAQNSGIRIYPNPTGNLVNVEIPAGKTGAQLSIKSSDGKELATLKLTQPRQAIDMKNYPGGIYFFYISNNGNLLDAKKVVKE